MSSATRRVTVACIGFACTYACATAVDAALRRRGSLGDAVGFHFGPLDFTSGLVVISMMFGVPVGIAVPGSAPRVARADLDRALVFRQLWRRSFVIATAGGSIVGAITLCTAAMHVDDGSVPFSIYGAEGGAFWGGVAGVIVGGVGGALVAGAGASVVDRISSPSGLYLGAAVLAIGAGSIGVGVIVLPPFSSEAEMSTGMPDVVVITLFVTTAVVALLASPYLVRWIIRAGDERTAGRGPTMTHGTA